MRGFPLRRAGSGDCGSQSPSQTLGCPPLDVLALRGPWESSPVLGELEALGAAGRGLGVRRGRPVRGLCGGAGLRGSGVPRPPLPE